MSRWPARAALLVTLGIALCTASVRAEIASDAGSAREDDAGVAPASSGGLRREGAWPADELVTLKLEGIPRTEAIRKLADAAGWSVIVRGAGSEPVDVRVAKQPAARVLALILAGETFVAQRDGSMIAIAPATDTAPISARSRPPSGPNMPVPPPPPPLPPPPPEPPRHGDDKLVTAGNAVIGVDEVVGDLTVLAGNVDVYGIVNGDLAVFAGNVQVHAGARVHGDVSAVAGQVEIEQGATVDGDVSGMVGQIKRGDRARDGHDDDADAADDDARAHDKKQRAIARAHRRWSRGHIDTQDDDADDDEPDEDAQPTALMRVERAGNAVARSALLFAFGAVLLAMAGTRVQRLQAEVATRPMHALVVGGVSLFLGALAVLVTTVTIIGIPLALAAVLVGAVGVYAGICAALTALGRAILHTRTPSAYLHLALGCAIYLIASALPGIGWVVTAAAVMIGFGALVRTRAGGLFSRMGAPPAPPSEPPPSPSAQLGPEL